MSIINNGLLLASGADAAVGYQISRSLRFNASDSAYCSRVPSTAGNRKTWTWAGWVKRSALGEKRLFSNGNASANNTEESLTFGSDNTLELVNVTQNVSVNWQIATSAFFRDVAAWYHIVIKVDTPQAAPANRVVFFINGQQVTNYAIASYPAQNSDTLTSSTVLHNIGIASVVNNRGYDGYLADIHFIDGQALDPTSFTEVSATTGQLVPKAYTGSYGTNGFKLTFSDNSGTTSSTLGKDTSGNNNDWTPTNFSVAAGAGNDSLVDTPTSYGTDTGAGGEVRGNYATLLDQYVNVKARLTVTNGNLDVTFNYPEQSSSALSSIAVSSGKWYSEFTCVQTGNYYAFVGIASAKDKDIESIAYNDTYAYANSSGQKVRNGSGSAYGATWTAGDVIGVALDMDAGTIVFYKNGVSQGTAFTSISGTYIFGCTGFLNWKFTANFGQRAFAYTAPSGFKALCDTNLTAPTIAKPNTVMDVVLYTGNGTTRTVSGLGFSPDLVWLRNRTQASNWVQFDTVRGTLNRLCSNLTVAEASLANSLTSFDSTGFTYGSEGSGNNNGDAFAAFCWDAGTSTVTNTQGSISSQVRANASAGFSIVTYTGNLSGAGVSTVGHGLGVAPSMVITKRRDGASNWCVQHISTSTAYQILFLDTTDAEYNTSSNGTLSRPTSTVFSINNSTGLGVNGQTHVAYAFAPVTNYSSFGSYTGNGSTDGPFVYTGFRPRWVLIKSSSAAGESWFLLDTSRSPYNVSQEYLMPNSSAGETSAYTIMDILSNGFKLKTSAGGSAFNGSGATYVYACFAESPLQYARAR